MCGVFAEVEVEVDVAVDVDVDAEALLCLACLAGCVRRGVVY